MRVSNPTGNYVTRSATLRCFCLSPSCELIYSDAQFNHLPSSVFCCLGGTRDVYVDFNELTLRVTQEALFGIRAEEVPTRRQPMQPTAALTSPRPSAHTYASETLPGVSVPASTPAAATTVAAVSSNSASHSYGTSSEEAQQIVAAVQKAFTFFTQRCVGPCAARPQYDTGPGGKGTRFPSCRCGRTLALLLHWPSTALGPH